MKWNLTKLMSICLLFLMACTDGTDAMAQTAQNIADSQKGTVMRDLTIHSDILGRDMLYSVYLPANYTESKQYPVLYLLHGWGGNQNEWWVYDDLADDADKMIASDEVPEMVIITPDGQTWRYMDNNYGNGLYYERYFFEEFLPYVETRYRIRSDRSSRAIGGFSMGGYGALRYGFVHHDMFCYVYALSAMLDGNGTVPMNEIAPEYAPSVLPGITLECGDNDYFTTDNREFSAQLASLGIAHEHIERPGSHDWDFWSACSPKILRKVGDFFRQASTGIQNVSSHRHNVTAIYSLSGTRRDTMQRGINIVNGKKIIKQ